MDVGEALLESEKKDSNVKQVMASLLATHIVQEIGMLRKVHIIHLHGWTLYPLFSL